MADGKKKQASLADDLREEVAAYAGPEDRTVIRFDYCFDLTVKRRDREVYTYVAIWVATRSLWYVSGIGSAIPREMSHEALMKTLAKENTVSAEVATALDTFKP